MFTFEQQARILALLLNKPTNKKCADCGSSCPTWASLDFGVFVCSNCSGAHRALGPTVTRIKSTTLDLWNKDWFANMVLGNNQLNLFWEADSVSATTKKPKSGAILEEYNRFVYDKYIKRKFVADKQATNPLVEYKNGNYKLPKQNETVNQVREKPSITSATKIAEVPTKYQSGKKPKQNNFSLLDDDVDLQVASKNNNVESMKNTEPGSWSVHKNLSSMAPEEDEFGEYVQPISQIKPIVKSVQDPSLMSFDDLFKNPKSEANPHINPLVNHHGNPHMIPPINPHMNSHMNSHMMNPQMINPQMINPQMNLHHNYHPQQRNPNSLGHNQGYMSYAPQGNPNLMGQQSYSPQPHHFQSQPQSHYQNFTLN